jgi:uncharacterized repeat protein (TIGR01451 family)
VVVSNADATCPVIYPTITLVGHVAPTLLAVNFAQPSDCDVSDGTITILATGGNAPLQYSIDSMQTWHNYNVFTNVGPGYYYIFVRNADGSCAVAYAGNPIISCEFDLALRKTLAPGQPQNVKLGHDVHFRITVFNQGLYTAKNISIVDYIPNNFIMSGVGNSIWTLQNVQTNGVPHQQATTVIAGPLASGDSTFVDINFW